MGDYLRSAGSHGNLMAVEQPEHFGLIERESGKSPSPMVLPSSGHVRRP